MKQDEVWRICRPGKHRVVPVFPDAQSGRADLKGADVASIAAGGVGDGGKLKWARFAALVKSPTQAPAFVNRRAAGQQGMGESETAIVCKFAKQWIGVNLIGRMGQDTAAVIIAQIVPGGTHLHTVDHNIWTRSASLENRVVYCQQCAAICTVDKNATRRVAGRVATERARCQRYTAEAAPGATAVNSTALSARQIAADGTDPQRNARAPEIAVIPNSAAHSAYANCPVP